MVKKVTWDVKSSKWSIEGYEVGTAPAPDKDLLAEDGLDLLAEDGQALEVEGGL